jgi:hypothetical protein
MTISNELMYALLSMDSYNRGYGYGLDVVAAGASTTQIGNAAVGLNSNDPSSGIIGGQAAGFFAQSYTLNGQKIIAYRGTDNNLPPPWGDGTGSDAWNGYGTVVGAPFNAQALMAADFFQAVTGTTTANPATGNAILTGHSLGNYGDTPLNRTIVQFQIVWLSRRTCHCSFIPQPKSKPKCRVIE